VLAYSFVGRFMIYIPYCVMHPVCFHALQRYACVILFLTITFLPTDNL
jgi:hypothetical protein